VTCVFAAGNDLLPKMEDGKERKGTVGLELEGNVEYNSK